MFPLPLKMGPPGKTPLCTVAAASPAFATMHASQKSWRPLGAACHHLSPSGMNNPLSVTTILGKSGMLQQNWALVLKVCCKEVFSTEPPMHAGQKSWTPLGAAWHHLSPFGMRNPLSVTTLLGKSGMLQPNWALVLKICCKEVFNTEPPIKWHASKETGYGPMLLQKKRCYARTWGGGWGTQCTHKRKKKYFFCRLHRTEDLRPHGEYCSAPKPAHKFAHSPILCVDGQPPMKKYKQRMPVEAKALPMEAKEA